MDKEKIKVVTTFSGIGMQERGIEDSDVFDMDVLATSDIDKEAILSYASIHNGLTMEEVKNYKEYPSKEEMIEELKEKNIGYDFVKQKPYDWEKIGRRKDDTLLKKYWLAVHKANNLGDISKVKRLPECDLLTFSFPCVTEDSLILTKEGYKQIKDVKVGDMVLTKSNTWHPVAKKFDNGIHQTCYIDAMGFENIHCTLNHRFYVREKYKTYSTYENGKRGEIRNFKEPEFKEAKDLTKNDYFGIPVIQEEIPFFTDDLDFWYMIGYYIGDGFLSVADNDIRLCCNDDKLRKLEEYLDINKYHYTISDKEILCHKLCFSNKEIYEFIAKYIGTGCHNKNIPIEILFLPKAQLEAFLNGYIDSDGNSNSASKNPCIRIDSANKNLIYATAMIINKLYKRPVSIYKAGKRKKEHKIDGRVIKEGDLYQLKFKYENHKQDKAFYEDGYIWYPFNKLTMDKEEHVYNLEVEEDHSYILQGCISANCTDISIAGTQKGVSFEDWKKGASTRSGLVWEVVRLIKEAKKNNELPKYLLMENVSALVSKKFIHEFERLNQFFDELGYNVYWKIINGKDTGIPQNRPRVFGIYIRKDIDKGKFTFPLPFDNGLRIKDILEENVDSKYYLSQKIQGRFKITDESFKKDIIGNVKPYFRTVGQHDIVDDKEKVKENKLTAANGNKIDIVGTTKPESRKIGQRDIVYGTDGIMGSLVATDYKQPKQILEPKIHIVGELDIKAYDSIKRVFGTDGIAPTLTTMQGGHRQPKILESNKGNIKEIANGNKLLNKIISENDINDKVACDKTLADPKVRDVANCITSRYDNGISLNFRQAGTAIIEKEADTEVLDHYYIRKLTPKECFALMGLTMEDAQKCYDMRLSDASLYKQAGNGIITNAIKLLMQHLYKAQYDENYVCEDELYNIEKNQK